ncbi:MAG: hypothetical protein HN348_08115 [Proteobacteria bacterium]|jgi:hypothetical protein|nr:hypothetical protein [Pseudomonadota bacterium]
MRLVAVLLLTLVISLGCAGGPGPIEGIFCEYGTDYCYIFEEGKVTEDMAGSQALGTWSIEKDLLLLHFKDPDQTITWRIEQRSDSVLMLYDHKVDEIFVLNKVDRLPQ